MELRSLVGNLGTLALGCALSLSASGCDADDLLWLQELVDGACQGDGICPGDAPAGSTGVDEHGTSGMGTSGQEACDDSSQGSDADAADATDTTQEPMPECAVQETRTVACGNCGEMEQRCVDGKWEDEGRCRGQRSCAPGGFVVMTHQGRFDCGSVKRVILCDEQCRFSDELDDVFVTSCGAPMCCGSAPGARVACLDPDDLPEGGYCRTGPLSEASKGESWMTPSMWEEHIKKLEAETGQEWDG